MSLGGKVAFHNNRTNFGADESVDTTCDASADSRSSVLEWILWREQRER